MSLQESKPKKEKTLSPQQLERKKIKDQITSAKQHMKDLETRLKTLTPEPSKKEKVVITDTMRLAQSVGKSLHEKKKNKEGKEVPKMVASTSEFRKQCTVIVGLADARQVTRSQVYSVVSQGIALLETMPKPAPKPRKEK